MYDKYVFKRATYNKQYTGLVPVKRDKMDN